MSSSCATQQHTGPQGNHASAAQPTQQIGLEGRSSCSSSSSSDTSRIYSPIRSSTEPSIRDHNSYDEPMGRAPTAGDLIAIFVKPCSHQNTVLPSYCSPPARPAALHCI
eukprot:scaffold130404_cov15-Tisochrysis_lutea.AAC.1